MDATQKSIQSLKEIAQSLNDTQNLFELGCAGLKSRIKAVGISNVSKLDENKINQIAEKRLLHITPEILRLQNKLLLPRRSFYGDAIGDSPKDKCTNLYNYCLEAWCILDHRLREGDLPVEPSPATKYEFVIEENTSIDNKACSELLKHTEWNHAQIAEKIGCHEKHLIGRNKNKTYRCPKYMKARGYQETGREKYISPK